MVIEKFPYIFKKFVKSPVALVKRNQISTWAMWKSDFHMTHEEIILNCCYLTNFLSSVSAANAEKLLDWTLFFRQEIYIPV